LTDKEVIVLTIFNDLGNLGKSLDNLQKAQGGLGSGGGLSGDLTKLTDGLSSQAETMRRRVLAQLHARS
jgi:hypothetical protein